MKSGCLDDDWVGMRRRERPCRCAGLCLVMTVMHGDLGPDLPRRRYWLLVIVGSFYLVLGVFVFLVSFIQSIHDTILRLSSANATLASNGSDHCGELRSFYTVTSRVRLVPTAA